MEDLLSMPTTTAEQKFMLMMFERLEQLEDRVNALTAENKELKDTLKRTCLPDKVCSTSDLIQFPTQQIYCVLILKDKDSISPVWKMLKSLYVYTACFPIFSEDTNVTMYCLLEKAGCNFTIVEHAHSLSKNLSTHLDDRVSTNISITPCICNKVKIYYAQQFALVHDLVMADGWVNFGHWLSSNRLDYDDVLNDADEFEEYFSGIPPILDASDYHIDLANEDDLFNFNFVKDLCKELSIKPIGFPDDYYLYRENDADSESDEDM